MAQRIVDKPQFQTGPQVTARPVDTYVRPGVSKAQQVAAALTSIQPAIQQWSGILSDKYIDNQYEEAKATVDAAAAQGKSFAQAQKEGLIPSHMNPWFKRGVSQRYAEVSGISFDTDLKAKAKVALKDVTDLEAVNTYASEFYKGWKEANLGPDVDADTKAAFDHYAAASVAKLRASYSGVADENLKKKANGLWQSRVKSFLANETSGLSFEDVVNRLNFFAQMQSDVGITEDEIETNLLEAIGGQAKEESNYAPLDLLGALPSQYGTSLKDTPMGIEYIGKLRKDIALQRTRDDTEYQRARKATIELGEQNLARRVIELKSENKQADLSVLATEFKDLPGVLGKIKEYSGQWGDVESGDDDLVDWFEMRIYRPKAFPEGVTRETEILEAVVGNKISIGQGQELLKILTDTENSAEARARARARAGREKALYDVWAMQRGEAALKAAIPNTMGSNGGELVNQGILGLYREIHQKFPNFKDLPLDQQMNIVDTYTNVAVPALQGQFQNNYGYSTIFRPIGAPISTPAMPAPGAPGSPQAPQGSNPTAPTTPTPAAPPVTNVTASGDITVDLKMTEDDLRKAAKGQPLPPELIQQAKALGYTEVQMRQASYEKLKEKK